MTSRFMFCEFNEGLCVHKKSQMKINNFKITTTKIKDLNKMDYFVYLLVMRLLTNEHADSSKCICIQQI